MNVKVGLELASEKMETLNEAFVLRLPHVFIRSKTWSSFSNCVVSAAL